MVNTTPITMRTARPASSQRSIVHHQPAKGEVSARDTIDASYRTFSVARPIMARTNEKIHMRMTICGSCQPIFSRW